MSARLVVHLSRGTLRLGQGVDDCRTVSYADADGLADAIASLAPAPAQSRRAPRMLVLVEPPLLQRRTLKDLPPVRNAALLELVAHGTARFFRQNGQPLLSAATWATEGEPPERVARAVAVEELLAEAIVAGAMRGGLQLEDILAAGETVKPLSLLPVVERHKRARGKWRRVGALALGTALLCLVVGLGALIQLRLERRRVGEELARLKEPRIALAAARLSMDSAVAMVLAMQSSAGQRDALAARLLHAMRALPDSGFLSSLTLDRLGTGTAEGWALQAGQVEARLNAVPSLAPVRLTSSGARDVVAGHAWERFALRLGAEEIP